MRTILILISAVLIAPLLAMAGIVTHSAPVTSATPNAARFEAAIAGHGDASVDLGLTLDREACDRARRLFHRHARRAGVDRRKITTRCTPTADPSHVRDGVLVFGYATDASGALLWRDADIISGRLCVTDAVPPPLLSNKPLPDDAHIRVDCNSLSSPPPRARP